MQAANHNGTEIRSRREFGQPLHFSVLAAKISRRTNKPLAMAQKTKEIGPQLNQGVVVTGKKIYLVKAIFSLSEPDLPTCDYDVM
jgi:hypothetical protein